MCVFESISHIQCLCPYVQPESGSIQSYGNPASLIDEVKDVLGLMFIYLYTYGWNDLIKLITDPPLFPVNKIGIFKWSLTFLHQSLILTCKIQYNIMASPSLFYNPEIGGSRHSETSKASFPSHAPWSHNLRYMICFLVLSSVIFPLSFSLV